MASIASRVRISTTPPARLGGPPEVAAGEVSPYEEHLGEKGMKVETRLCLVFVHVSRARANIEQACGDGSHHR